MREWLELLDAAGDVNRVERAVDPAFELAAVTLAAQRRDRKALTFERVGASALPVVTNLYTDPARLAALIGATPPTFCRDWSRLIAALEQGATPPVRRIEPPADRVSGRLSDLPQITYHERDAGPYLTSAIFLANDPESGAPNLSFHRSMIVSDGELRVRLGESHNLAAYMARAEALEQPLEAAILIGVAPELFLAACASIPEQASEIELAAQVRGRALPVHPGRTVGLDIPADTEVVIEGRFLPGLRRPEGPFGEFMGYYVPEGDNAVFEVSAVYWRPGAVFHSLLCGSDEDRVPLQMLTAAKTWRFLDERLPGIVDVSCAPSLLNTTIKIHQQYEGHARDVLRTAIEADTDYHKLCIVVDADDELDTDSLVRAIVSRGRIDQRTHVVEDLPGFYRDPHKDHWGRLGIDATRPFDRAAEFVKKTVPGADDIDLGLYLGEPDGGSSDG